ncbi:MAG: hypothetical protein V4673_05445 [Pseudomonadota bacterium]
MPTDTRLPCDTLGGALERRDESALPTHPVARGTVKKVVLMARMRKLSMIVDAWRRDGDLRSVHAKRRR